MGRADAADVRGGSPALARAAPERLGQSGTAADTEAGATGAVAAGAAWTAPYSTLARAGMALEVAAAGGADTAGGVEEGVG